MSSKRRGGAGTNARQRRVSLSTEGSPDGRHWIVADVPLSNLSDVGACVLDDSPLAFPVSRRLSASHAIIATRDIASGRPDSATPPLRYPVPQMPQIGPSKKVATVSDDRVTRDIGGSQRVKSLKDPATGCVLRFPTCPVHHPRPHLRRHSIAMSSAAQQLLSKSKPDVQQERTASPVRWVDHHDNAHMAKQPEVASPVPAWVENLHTKKPATYVAPTPNHRRHSVEFSASSTRTGLEINSLQLIDPHSNAAKLVAPPPLMRSETNSGDAVAAPMPSTPRPKDTTTEPKSAETTRTETVSIAQEPSKGESVEPTGKQPGTVAKMSPKDHHDPIDSVNNEVNNQSVQLCPEPDKDVGVGTPSTEQTNQIVAREQRQSGTLAHASTVEVEVYRVMGTSHSVCDTSTDLGESGASLPPLRQPMVDSSKSSAPQLTGATDATRSATQANTTENNRSTARRLKAAAHVGAVSANGSFFPPHILQSSKKVARAMQRVIGKEKNIRFADLFNTFDVRGANQISLDEFEGAVNSIQATLSREDAQDLFHYVDSGGKGYLTKRDFAAIVRPHVKGARRDSQPPRSTSRSTSPESPYGSPPRPLGYRDPFQRRPSASSVGHDPFSRSPSGELESKSPPESFQRPSDISPPIRHFSSPEAPDPLPQTRTPEIHA